VLALALGLGAAPAGAGIDTTPSVPTQGESVRLTVTDAEGMTVAGALVRAVYRPQSEVERAEEIGTTDDGGRVSWTPTGAGIVNLEAVLPSDRESLSRNISVRFRGIPTTGLFILAFAGLILYGSVVRGFWSLTRTPPPSLPPDT
jgi:hypothetical protein